ncbi:hypothetical protein MBSPM3_v1c3890 [Maize bushy stunt phytoplasma]|uniref:Uncharacterized protein n=1 Tax=Maize bushy stunt phytoplasma TaxID=202462 RepID=A0ABM6DMB6_9MOLU|nr:hypothetical protein MBSPM3_v1c3890 [Maize bushy stunt phytoplasma]
MLHLNDLTMNKEDVSLSFHALKTFNSIKRGTLIKNKLKLLRIIYFLLRLLISVKVAFLSLCLCIYIVL